MRTAASSTRRRAAAAARVVSSIAVVVAVAVSPSLFVLRLPAGRPCPHLKPYLVSCSNTDGLRFGIRRACLGEKRTRDGLINTWLCSPSQVGGSHEDGGRRQICLVQVERRVGNYHRRRRRLPDLVDPAELLDMLQCSVRGQHHKIYLLSTFF